MAIGGKQREQREFQELQVGLFEAEVIAFNPSEEEFSSILGIQLSEDSKATEYLSENDNGNVKLRLSIWLKDVKTEQTFNMNLFLENEERTNQDGSKLQFINNIGTTSWADSQENLPDWFVKRDYRQAMKGEEQLYTFLRSWLAELDYMDDGTILEVDWKKLMRGNVRELKEQIGGGYSKTFIALATVVSKERDGEIKEYQGVYTKAFLPVYARKFFRTLDYNNDEVLESIKAKKNKDRKVQERFVLDIKGEYGCRDFYVLRDLCKYDPSENVMSGNEPITEGESDY